MADHASAQPEQTKPKPKLQVRDHGQRNSRNKLFEVVCLCATGLAIVILAVLLLSIITQGVGSLGLDFLRASSSSDPDKAGVSTALVGTIIICLICAISAIPLGVGTAVLIEEFRPKHPLLLRLHDIIETNIRNLAGVPSIVYGLLGIGVFVFMFNVFGPINNGSFAIGQTWYDQYVDATGQQLYLPIDGPGAPAMPLYDGPVDTPTPTQVWRTQTNEETGEETDLMIHPVPRGDESLLRMTLDVDGVAVMLTLDESSKGTFDFGKTVKVGDEVRFNPYFDPVLKRSFYSSFKVTAVYQDKLAVAGSPITGLYDARDGSGQRAQYELVTRKQLQPIKTRIESQLAAFGQAIREGIREYRVREDGGFVTRFPREGKQVAAKAIVVNALAQYPFEVETVKELQPRLIEQIVALDGQTSTKTRAERNRFIKAASDAELKKQLGGQILIGQNPTRVDTKSWYHFALPLGRGVLTGGLTLMLVILPIVIVASQEALRAVPGSYRQGALALGATKWQSVSLTALPAAIPGICTGTILAISRAIGEAAPILVIGAAGYVSRNPAHLMDGFSAMPVTIFQWTREPGEAFRGIAAAGIIVLLLVLLSFNALAIYIRQRSTRNH